MTAERDSQTVEISQADGEEYARLNRARLLMAKVFAACELEWDEAMNVTANVLVALAVQQCRPRDEITSAVGEMYDLRLKRDAEDETVN